MPLQLPIDLTSLPPFRLLEAALGPARALWLWWVVWRELAYLMEEGCAPGRIRAEDQKTFMAALTVPECSTSSQGLWALLLSSRLLKADGPDWICARFSLLHEGPSHRSQAQRGGDLKAYHGRQKKLESDAFQQALQITESKMVDEHGEPLTSEMRQRVTRLVVSCDNSLFKNLRPPHGYSEGLVQDALRVLARFSDEQIGKVCLFVAEHRNHPLLSTTERLLPVFGEISRMLEGQA
jgi:hypothetical protein